jgi:hypothetical protein
MLAVSSSFFPGTFSNKGSIRIVFVALFPNQLFLLLLLPDAEPASSHSLHLASLELYGTRPRNQPSVGQQKFTISFLRSEELPRLD